MAKRKSQTRRRNKKGGTKNQELPLTIALLRDELEPFVDTDTPYLTVLKTRLKKNNSLQVETFLQNNHEQMDSEEIEVFKERYGDLHENKAYGEELQGNIYQEKKDAEILRRSSSSPSSLALLSQPSPTKEPSYLGPAVGGGSATPTSGGRRRTKRRQHKGGKKSKKNKKRQRKGGKKSKKKSKRRH